MHPTAADTWNDLSAPWKRCFDEAWLSWCEGNFGIGAVLFDPTTNDIVSVGRNRISTGPAEAPDEHGQAPLANTFLAHAEMNAFATLPRFKADGLHLYTTLEPCLMCESTAMLMHTDHIHFAGSDALFARDDSWWEQHSYAARRKVPRTGPMNGRLARFAQVLPLSLTAETAPNSKVMIAAQADTPNAAALATELAADKTLHFLRQSGSSTQEALADLWPRLL